MRRVLLALLPVLVLASVACSSSDDDDASDTTDEVDTTFSTTATVDEEDDATTTDSEDESEVAADYPCDVVADSESVELFGGEVDASVITNNVTENDASWVALQCEWTSFDDAALSASLAVSVADDFPDGEVGCPEVIGDAVAVPDLGDSAMWAYEDAGTEITIGNLRVCSADALIDVEVSGVSDEASLQALATDLAQRGLDTV